MPLIDENNGASSSEGMEGSEKNPGLIVNPTQKAPTRLPPELLDPNHKGAIRPLNPLAAGKAAEPSKFTMPTGVHTETSTLTESISTKVPSGPVAEVVEKPSAGPPDTPVSEPETDQVSPRVIAETVEEEELQIPRYTPEVTARVNPELAAEVTRMRAEARKDSIPPKTSPPKPTLSEGTNMGLLLRRFWEFLTVLVGLWVGIQTGSILPAVWGIAIGILLFLLWRRSASRDFYRRWRSQERWGGVVLPIFAITTTVSMITTALVANGIILKYGTSWVESILRHIFFM
jgi:hypothetical protein